MNISMHAMSHGVFRKALTQLLHVMDKATANAKARSFDTSVLVNSRLAPDMLPFARQVQIAADHAKACTARLAGVENPKYEDNEATLDELRARIRKTLEFVQSVPADKVDGSEQREIVVPLRNGELKFTGEGYLKHYAMPNFYFHCTTAYALLRHAGVDIGKVDYIGAAG